jgi:hypothetical protein
MALPAVAPRLVLPRARLGQAVVEQLVPRHAANRTSARRPGTAGELTRAPQVSGAGAVSWVRSEELGEEISLRTGARLRAQGPPLPWRGDGMEDDAAACQAGAGLA